MACYTDTGEETPSEGGSQGVVCYCGLETEIPTLIEISVQKR